MDLATERVPTTRLPWRQLGVLALIAVLLAAALAVYVGSRPRVPEPFGVAANGLVAYVDDQGAIQGVNPITGESQLFVPGPGNERPVFSPDGSRIAYLRPAASGGVEVVVAGSNGERPIALTAESLPSVAYLGWSPDSGSIAVSIPPDRLQILDASTPSPPRIVTVDGAPLRVMAVDDFNASTLDIFRPPLGEEIVFVGSTAAGPALFVANADGAQGRAIIDPESSAVPYSAIDAPQWSPDGTRLAVALAAPGEPNVWRIHILNADGSGLRLLSEDARSRSEGHPSWSPDGTRVAFQRWFALDGCGLCDTQPITVVGVDDGAEVQVGLRNVDGYTGWSWSPDGTSILQVAQNVSERRLQIAPLDGGPPTFVDVITAFPPNWQRVAPPD